MVSEPDQMKGPEFESHNHPFKNKIFQMQGFKCSVSPLSHSLSLSPICTPGKMGAKARKAAKKDVKKASAQFSATGDATPDFLPLEGGKARNLPKTENTENKATVLYIGRVPHGFFEDEMEAFFKQFGTVKRLRIARNRKTGKSKHFGFMEFESPEVAKVVEECMHNYLMYEHLLQVRIVPPEKVHPKIWKVWVARTNPLIGFKLKGSVTTRNGHWNNRIN
ncbi:hypothetical protein MIMGU_mgv1a013439mg [Erythranthe guttata]|uniref:RRM domain-containing protein n=1 Tax=Erythranthe guttata TaxID=4155 RepID=A0A022QX13_ERYGU|nr:hypothetical protein MIMGU_mgv1a013439mg [Erythranthe guttata]